MPSRTFHWQQKNWSLHNLLAVRVRRPHTHTHTHTSCKVFLKYLHMVSWGKYAWKTPKTKIGLTSRRVRDKWNTSWKQLRRQTARSYIQQIVQLCGFWLLVDTMAILLHIFSCSITFESFWKEMCKEELLNLNSVRCYLKNALQRQRMIDCARVFKA